MTKTKSGLESNDLVATIARHNKLLLTNPISPQLRSGAAWRYVSTQMLRGSIWKSAASLTLAVAALLVFRIAGQQASEFPAEPLPERTAPLRKALLFLREGKTAEAREELQRRRELRPNDPEVLYQIARSHLADFYKEQDPKRQRVALSLAMEMLDSTLKRSPDHIPALRAKAVIHAQRNCCTTTRISRTSWPRGRRNWSRTTKAFC